MHRSVLLAVLSLLSVLSWLDAEFTPDFRKFLDSRYGTAMRERLERKDMGLAMMGSFGGKEDANQAINNRVGPFSMQAWTTKNLANW